MKQENAKLMIEAERAKCLYLNGHISREEAREKITPYIEAVNRTAVELGKSYGVRPKLVTFEGFTR